MPYLTALTQLNRSRLTVHMTLWLSVLSILNSGCRETPLTTLSSGTSTALPPVSVNMTQITYSDVITQAELQRLQRYLLESGIANGEHRVVALDKRGSTYLFQIAVFPKVIADLLGHSLFRALATELSQSVFEGAPVDVHLCDPNLRPLVVTPMYSFGVERRFGALQLFSQERLAADAERLGRYLNSGGLGEGDGASAQLIERGGVYQVKLVVKPELAKLPAHDSTFRALPRLLSRAVFKGARVEFHITDAEFNTLKVFK